MNSHSAICNTDVLANDIMTSFYGCYKSRYICVCVFDLMYFDSSEISHGTRVKVIHLDSRFYNLQ